MTVEEHRFEDRDRLIDAVYRQITAVLEQALAQKSRASLAASGGSTPLPLYRRLAAAPLDWSRVDVALVDERWVDTGDDSSNERLLRENLLRGNASAAAFTGMKNDHPDPFAGEDQCNLAYAALEPPFDVCLLGMGSDGHTASLFPAARGLPEALTRAAHCAAIEARRSAVTGDNLARMTLTPWSILQSRRLILLFTGEEKWAVYRQACRADATAELPVSLFIHQDRVRLEVYWAP